jgi:VCBS repeat-containing protein
MNNCILVFVASVFIAVGSIYAQSIAYISLQGYVYYKNGRPMRDATVHLINSSSNATTDTTGIFHLQGQVGVKSNQTNRTHLFNLSLVSNLLCFTLAESGTRVVADLFELNGRKCASLLNGMFSKGDYTVPLQTKHLGNNLYFVRVAIGSHMEILRIFPLNQTTEMTHQANSTEQAVAYLSKKTSYQDTLVVRAPDGAVKNISIDSINSTNPVFVEFENMDMIGDITDAALSELPMVTPLIQYQYYRYSGYYFVTRSPVPYKPTFSPETLTYAATFDSTVVIGINPIARSPRANLSVSLDGAPRPLSPWITIGWTWPSNPTQTLSSVAYTCTLSTANQTKLLSTTVVSQDKSNSRTYNLTLKRN